MRADKKWICPVLTLMLTLFAFSIALACEHIDSGEGYVMWNSYVAPTETSDGSTGPGTCSVCGAVVEGPSVIPKLATQRQVSDPEPPPPPTDPPVTDPPAPPPTDPPAPPPTDPPAPPPTDPPAPPPTDPPAPPPADPPVQQASPATDPPAPVSAPAATPVPTQVPTAVPAPASTPVPTSVPTPVQPAGGNSGGGESSQATPQPDLAQVNPPRQEEANNSGSQDAPAGGSGGAGGQGQQRPGSGNRNGYPIFSSRFPWRRLRMTPQPGIEVRIAGNPVWPRTEAASPLMTLLNP